MTKLNVYLDPISPYLSRVTYGDDLIPAVSVEIEQYAGEPAQVHLTLWLGDVTLTVKEDNECSQTLSPTGTSISSEPTTKGPPSTS